MKKIVLPIFLLLSFLPGISLAECIEGKCKNGKGVYAFSDGSRYEGMFRNGRIEGEGTLKYADKSMYTGSFIGGVPHGQGYVKYSDGATSEGHFDKGTLSGKGILNSLDGSSYEGGFQNGLFHGKGTFTFADGKKYEGDFKDGLFDGQGTFTTEESALTVNYEEGNCVGKGTITFFKDDTSIAGECKDGEFTYTKKVPLPKTEMAAEVGQEPKKADPEFEFQVYEPENIYKEPDSFEPENVYKEQDVFEPENVYKEQDAFEPEKIYREPADSELSVPQDFSEAK